LVVNVSIDGVGKQHDFIRGIDGSFKLAVRTVGALKKMHDPRLVVGVNTVVSKYNARSFGKIFSHVTRDLKPDSYVAEVAESREKLHAGDLSITPSAKELRISFSEMAEFCRKSRTFGLTKLARAGYYHGLACGMPDDHKGIFEGVASVYLMPDGEAWLSCSKKLVAGNIRNVGYDLKKIWFGNKANAARRIMNKGYSTTAANAFYTNYVCNLSNSARLAAQLALNL
jgi:MoaA/NifB/PqqE/SkfB family radical SAM enzyme